MAAKTATPSINKINAATAHINTPKTDARRAPATAKVKPTVTEQPTTEEAQSSYFDQMSEMFGDFKMPSGKRMLCSVVAQLFVLASGIYSGIQMGMYLGFAAMMFTGSSFIAFIATALAVGIALYASLIAAGKVAKYIALGQIDNDMARARSWVSSKFTSVKARFASSDELENA